MVYRKLFPTNVFFTFGAGGGSIRPLLCFVRCVKNQLTGFTAKERVGIGAHRKIVMGTLYSALPSPPTETNAACSCGLADTQTHTRTSSVAIPSLLAQRRRR